MTGSRLREGVPNARDNAGLTASTPHRCTRGDAEPATFGSQHPALVSDRIQSRCAMERRKTDYSVPEDCWTVGDAVTWIKYRVDPDALPGPALVEPCENPSQPVETAEQQLEKFREELEELNKAVRIGQLKALGRKNVLSRYQDVHLPREVIPLGTFDERLRFDLSGEGPARFISSDFVGLHDNPGATHEISFRVCVKLVGYPTRSLSM